MFNKEKLDVDAKIGEKIRTLMSESGKSQKDIAEMIGIAAPTLNQMISGVVPLAAERFFQVLAILNPSTDQLFELFRLYREKLSAKRYNQLIQIPAEQQTAQDRRELKIIQLWVLNSVIEDGSGSQLDALKVYVSKLNEEEAGKALSVLKVMFGEK